MPTCGACGSFVTGPLRIAPCPHCGARAASPGPSRAAVLLGLALAGCPSTGSSNLDYGLPPESDTDADTDTDETGDTGGR